MFVEQVGGLQGPDMGRDTLDDHYYKVLAYVIRAIDVLVNSDFFDEEDPSNHFAIELHLRCVVATFRVLTTYGVYNFAGYLTSELVEKLYDALARWSQILGSREQRGFRPNPRAQFENYFDSEFLIVYARDLVASISTDRDLMVQAVIKLAGGISPRASSATAAFKVPPSLQIIIQRMYPPSSWHTQYRTLEDFVLNWRLLKESSKRGDNKGLVKDAVADLETFSGDSEKYIFVQFKQLIENDVEAANQIQGLEPGTLPSILKDVDPEEDDIYIETPPVARTGHFAYALLDLIQRLINYGFPYANLKEIALLVIRKTQHTFLQRKAVELLLSIGKTGAEAMTEVENQIGQISNEGANMRPVASLWREVKRRADEQFNFRGQLSLVMVDYPDKKQDNDDPTQAFANKVKSLVDSLEELLVCPVPPSKGENMYQLLPCGHCQSRLAWSEYESVGRNYCSVCSTSVMGLGPPIPAGRIGDVLYEMKMECRHLEDYMYDIKHKPPQTPTRPGRKSLTRTSSEPAPPPFRHRITEFPKLFKKSDPHRRSSMSTEERSILGSLRRSSTDSSEIRGLVILSRTKIIGTSSASHAYQATAISANCCKVALIGPADFLVYEINPSFEPALLCWGDVNRRFATLPKPTIDQASPLSYHIAALSNDILAICSVETFLDIRNAVTGERIKHLRLPQSEIACRSVAFSPNGQHLAVGLESGDIFVYQAGLILDFAGQAIHLRYKINMAIGSIVFSHDSLLLAIFTKDNTVRAYRLDNLSYGSFVQFIEPAMYGKHSKVAEIADIGLYFPPSPFNTDNTSLPDSQSLYIAVKNKSAHPTVISRITAPRESQRLQTLTNIKQESEGYRVACFPNPDMLAVAAISCAGEFSVTNLSPGGTEISSVRHHTDILDTNYGHDSGFCSLGFSETRAIALDRKGNLLAMDMILT